MDALNFRTLLVSVTLLISTGASHRTANFVVTASSPAEARAVGRAAEIYRRRLALYWTGRELPRWERPCTIRVKSGALGAGGQTTFQFMGTQVGNWRMSVQGSSERILDSVLPHEINHTVFACYFRRPLPRWADEGASTLFEHRSEQQIQLDRLNRVTRSGRGYIPLKRLLNMKQYPSDQRSMLILYAQGFGLVDFLMYQGGPKTYLKFLNDGHRYGWENAIRRHYNHEGIDALETDWKSWVLAGMPRYGHAPEELVAMIHATTRDVARPVAARGRSRRQRPSRPAAESGRFPGSRELDPPTTASRPQRSAADTAAVEAPLPVKTSEQVPDGPIVPAVFGSGLLPSDSATVFPEGSHLEPTGHREALQQPKPEQMLLPWKRSRESGATPQWAGFPGQKGLF